MTELKAIPGVRQLADDVITVDELADAFTEVRIWFRERQDAMIMSAEDITLANTAKRGWVLHGEDAANDIMTYVRRMRGSA